VVPAGRSVEGLPLGVQLIASPWCEGTRLALGEIVERAAPI